MSRATIQHIVSCAYPVEEGDAATKADAPAAEGARGPVAGPELLRSAVLLASRLTFTKLFSPNFGGDV